MTQFWTIISRSDPLKVLERCVQSASPGQHPKDAGLAGWDAATMQAVQIPARPDPARMVWTGSNGKWTEDAAKVEAIVIPLIKAKNEDLVRSIYSTNFGKQKKYSRKQQEVLDFRALPGVLGAVVPNALIAPLSAFLPGLAAMSAEQQRKRFRYVLAEAKIRGVGADVVVNDIEKRIDADEDQIALWEAVEQQTIRQVKAATTAAAKWAAMNAANWAWKG